MCHAGTPHGNYAQWLGESTLRVQPYSSDCYCRTLPLCGYLPELGLQLYSLKNQVSCSSCYISWQGPSCLKPAIKPSVYLHVRASCTTAPKCYKSPSNAHKRNSHFCGGEIGGDQYRPQNMIILTMGTFKRNPDFWKPTPFKNPNLTWTWSASGPSKAM